MFLRKADDGPYLGFSYHQDWQKKPDENTVNLQILQSSSIKIIIWKAQGVPQSNSVAHPRHPEEEETSPNRNHKD